VALGSILCAYALDSTGFAFHHVACQTLVRMVGTPHADTNATMLPRTMDAMRGRAPEEIASLAHAPDRNRLLALLVVELSDALERYARDGFVAFRAEWQRRHALHDRFVEVRLPDGSSAHGIVAGVDERGALLVDRDGRRQRFVSGEVSVRGARR
jgi:BirA family biotin operon repressor/biotin-[acetyl-CoA-carboxylase] ligase